MRTLKIYTDGASRGNPGLSGWGFYIPEFFNVKSFGFSSKSTNNIMELTAIFEALRVTLKAAHHDHLNDVSTIEILSDSSYCVNIFNNWIYSWIKNKTISEKSNYKLILAIYSMIKFLRAGDWRVKFTKVPGHNGVYGNEVADSLCNKAMDDLNMNNVPDSIYGSLGDDKKSMPELIRDYLEEPYTDLCIDAYNGIY